MTVLPPLRPWRWPAGACQAATVRVRPGRIWPGRARPALAT
jgi:hypothetical protein